MFALVGTGALQTSSRNAVRPPVAEALAHRPLYSQRISARLWEDPLEAARRAEKIPNDDAANKRKWSASPIAFREQISDTPENRTLLLPIVVPDQMYPEIREQRLRIRYAVVSALTAANFNPESADELNLIPVPICTDLARKQAGQVLLAEQGPDCSWIPVPYEIFRRPKEELLRTNGGDDEPSGGGSKQPRQNGIHSSNSPELPGTALKSKYWQVVVFWIDERITKTPSLFRKNLDAILDTLSPAKLSDVRFISTQGSGTLTDILASKEAFGKNTNQTFYFPFATVPKQWLRTRVMERLMITPPSADMEPIVRMKPLKRVQASDDYVIEMLLDELSLRLPLFGKEDGEICLFYETDSFYGRSMVDVFNSRYKGFTGRNDARVESIPYLKGVDGTLPVRGDDSEPRLNAQDTNALVNAINKRLMEGNSEQWVLDQRQTDYVERQAHRLKSSQGEIKAIGVFGTSVFDKIKLIEILRNEFRNVWFFTVDLDASFINNDSPLATRNILIGSALELSVEAGTIRSPEFRDSYQSAAFLSTIDALGLLGRDYKGEPGVWETSRVGFERLNFSGKPIWKVDSMSDEQACGNGPEKGQAWSWDFFLKTHFQADGPKPARFLRLLLMILTAVFLVAVAKMIVEACRSPKKAALAQRSCQAIPGALASRKLQESGGRHVHDSLRLMPIRLAGAESPWRVVGAFSLVSRNQRLAFADHPWIRNRLRLLFLDTILRPDR